jgi:hypothetical protein
LVGARFLSAHLFNRRPVGILIGIHATLAVGGFVVLAACLFVG